MKASLIVLALSAVTAVSAFTINTSSNNWWRFQDFMYEHENGAYGGSLFCFAFTTDLMNLIDIKSKLKTGKKVLIPKGTQFGFFSSFQGSGSPFEKVTEADFYLKTVETGKNYCKYDCIDIIADVEQSYSIMDVYGCGSDFANNQNIKVL